MKKKILNTVLNLTLTPIIDLCILRDPYIPMWIDYSDCFDKLKDKNSQTESDNSFSK